MNKKAVLQLNTVGAVILALLVLSLLVLAGFVVVSEMTNVYESTETPVFGAIVNETVSSVGTGAYKPLTVLYSDATPNPICTVMIVINSSTSAEINTTLRTVSNCQLIGTTDGVAAGHNNTDWKVTYNYTSNTPYISSIEQNLTYGTTNFFSNVPTIFTLLGVTVLIVFISLVIVIVLRFASGEGKTGGSYGSEL